MRAPSLSLGLAAALLLGACGARPTSAAVTAMGQVGARSSHVIKSGERTLYVLPANGDGFLVSAIGQARHSVKLELYMLTDPGIVNSLIDARHRGLDVQVMLEPKPYNPSNPNAPLPVNHTAFNALRAAGVAIGDTSPAFTYTHAKLLTLDDTTSYVSTANFTKSGLNGNREYLVADSAQADVAEFVAMFKADQARQPFTPSNPDGVISPTNSRSRIFGLIQAAKHDVFLADEVAGDPALDALIQQKCAQGVHVRALLGQMGPAKGPGPAATPLNVVTARTWLAAGAEVRFQSAPVLHAKSVVADGKTMYVGSENLTTNSLDHNREVGLVLTDAALIAPVVAASEGDWAKATPAKAAQSAMLEGAPDFAALEL